ncbi:hypothetical protein SAMN02745157_4585 [Kaistia soli DSM 19436]|uniref:Uncharacterized protein n=2 Tax=Kaistia TaxID=166953 RepID=A0A1M5LG64_9HYPH|nr:hypothetical protein SAMN02745157_4585 [Kaistia soli DSM 19436]
MSEPKDPTKPRYPTVPPIDERANEAFLDTIFDTDGRPNSEAEAVVETEGLDEDEDEIDR